MGVILPPDLDSTRRFSGRAKYYAACRPRYAAAVIPFLIEHAGLSAASMVADIGSGTGISSELFLPHARFVFGVEPNPEMRAMAEERLSRYSNFLSVDGTAENTRLKDQIVDFVAVGTAFHWFDRLRCRGEFRRIRKPQGKLVVMTNRRLEEASPFMQRYDELIHKYGSKRIHPKWEEMMDGFLGPHAYETALFDNREQVDFGKLSGGLLSISWIPLPDESGHQEMMSELEELFERHQRGGTVDFRAETRLSWGIIQ